MSGRGSAFGDSRMEWVYIVPGDDVERVHQVHRSSMECATQALTLIHTSQYSVLSPQVSEMKQSNCSFTSFEAHPSRSALERLYALR